MRTATHNTRRPPVKYRRALNQQQIDTLYTLYYYRFCTSAQLATFLKKPHARAIQNKLLILEAQGFIAKRYTSRYKLAGRAAEYYLRPAGARALERALPHSTTPRAVQNLYKNSTVSDVFLKHCIAVTTLSLQLRSLYGSNLECFSASTMTPSSGYPEWKPDLHVRLATNEEPGTLHYFIDVWDGIKPFFVSVRKIRNYVNYREEDIWDETTAPFPAILAVCENTYSQKKLSRQMKRIMNEGWGDNDDLLFATTTFQSLAQARTPDDPIWLVIDPDDEPEEAAFHELFP